MALQVIVFGVFGICAAYFLDAAAREWAAFNPERTALDAQRIGAR